LATEDRKESDGIDGGVGHHAMTIAIQNRSSSPCILHGIPNLQLSYTATGRAKAICLFSFGVQQSMMETVAAPKPIRSAAPELNIRT
jgi:hypothetical protein